MCILHVVLDGVEQEKASVIVVMMVYRLGPSCLIINLKLAVFYPGSIQTCSKS